MSEENATIPIRATKRRHKPIRWLSALVVLGVVLVSGTILADVVLVYSANSQVGNTIAGPYQFQNGANYAVANGIGIASTTYAGGGATNGPSVTTTVNGIQTVGVAVLDVVEFTTVGAVANPASIGNLVVPTPTPIAVGGLLCAYAFVSNAIPTGAGSVGVPGEPAGCAATIPSLGAISPGCGAGPATVATIDLITGTIILPNLGGTCAMGPLAAGTVILYVSYWVTASGPIVGGPHALNVFTVPVTVT